MSTATRTRSAGCGSMLRATGAPLGPASLHACATAVLSAWKRRQLRCPSRHPLLHSTWPRRPRTWCAVIARPSFWPSGPPSTAKIGPQWKRLSMPTRSCAWTQPQSRRQSLAASKRCRGRAHPTRMLLAASSAAAASHRSFASTTAAFAVESSAKTAPPTVRRPRSTAALSIARASSATTSSSDMSVRPSSVRCAKRR